jgi:hypothetical protein
MQLTRGTTVPDFMENPIDRALICQEYDNNGTIEIARSLRIVPFTVTFTLAGGAAFEAETLTIPAAYEGEEIISAWGNMYSSTGTTFYEVHVAFSAFAAGGNTFTVTCRDTDGGAHGGGDYTVKGA